MAYAFEDVEAMRQEITRLTQAVETLKKDSPTGAYRRRLSHSSDPEIEFGGVTRDHGNSSTVSSRQCDVEPPLPQSRNCKRREIEARRFSGKEPIQEYLKQFELTAKRNKWTDSERASSLLCALDGSARTILAEIDDPESVSYDEIKQTLLRRFGPTKHTEIHEQALQDLRLVKGQPIRELSTEVLRLTKLAYPDFEPAARARLAVSALLHAIPEKDTVFYIRDRSPSTVEEVCSLFERFKTLTGTAASPRSVNVRGVRDSDEKPRDPPPALSQDVLAPLIEQGRAQQQQIGQLTEAVTALLQTQNTALSQPATPLPQSQHPSAPQSHHAAQPLPQQPYQQHQANPATMLPRPPPPHVSTNRPPPGPCPRCKQTGHWKAECPRGIQGNATGSLPAPSIRPLLQPPSQ